MGLSFLHCLSLSVSVLLCASLSHAHKFNVFSVPLSSQRFFFILKHLCTTVSRSVNVKPALTFALQIRVIAIN